MDSVEALLNAIRERDHAGVLAIVKAGFNLNRTIERGAPPLLLAVLAGSLPVVATLLQHGADPNLKAEEPACDELCPTPLDLALQCRHLMDWDLYHPIVQVLITHGAMDSEGGGEIADLARAEAESREWQRQRGATSESI